jgi:Tfp pilus assembly protein PilF
MSAEQKAKYYYELGYAHYHMEDYDKAKEAWKFADFGPYKAKLEKFSSKYFCNLSLGYLKFYENDISKQYAEHAIKIDKDFPTSYVLLAQLSKRNNDQTATIQNLENAIKSATDPQRKLPLLVQLTEIQLSGKDFDNALTNINAALELRPEEPKAVMLKAIVLYHKGANKECMDFVQKALTQRYDAATIAELNFVLGLAAKKANDTQVAKQAFLAASRSSLRDVAEAELRAMKELKVLEDEAELN